MSNDDAAAVSAASGAGASASAAPTPANPPPDERLSELLRSFSRISRAAAARGDEAASSGDGDPPADDSRGPAHRQRRAVQVQHAAMLDGLIRSLDIVAYAQISVLYYMDNSLLRLLLRLIPHWLFFTPKPAAFPPPPRRRPYVLSVVVVNALCIFFHLLFAPPAAGEATRGYLHGGFLIDFVGQRGPISKWRLLAADLAVLAAQIILLAVVRERERLRDRMGGGPAAVIAALASAVEAGASAAAATAGAQDHDAEEQGVRRELATDSLLAGDESLDGYGSEVEDGDEAMAGAGKMRATRREEHPLDRFYTGQFIVADLHIWDVLRASWKENSG